MINRISEKLAENYSTLSPSVIDVVNRTRSVGLHKIAAHIRGKQDFGLEDAVRELGVKLAYEYLKQQKIASGLTSLRDLHTDNTVKLSGLLSIGPNHATDITNALGSVAKKGFNPKATIRPAPTMATPMKPSVTPMLTPKATPVNASNSMTHAPTLMDVRNR